MTVIPVSIGSNFDPEDLKAVASDSKNVFPQDAVDSLKRAVKDAASLAPHGVIPGKKKKESFLVIFYYTASHRLKKTKADSSST